MTTTITDDELDAALNELAAEQKAWFKDAREKQQQETAKRQTATAMRIAVAMWIGFADRAVVACDRAQGLGPSGFNPCRKSGFVAPGGADRLFCLTVQHADPHHS